MTQARLWGRQAGEQWLFQGTVSGRSCRRRGLGDLTAVYRFCRTLGDQSGSAGRMLLDQLWLLGRESTRAAEALKPLRRLPAVAHEGRSARVLLLGESLAELELVGWEPLQDAVEGLQEANPLTEAELCALLPCLVLGMLHRIRLLTEHWEESESQAQRLKRCFDQLRVYTDRDWSRTLEGWSVVHQTLLRDPVYAAMAAGSRAACRHQVVKLARREGLSQQEMAQRLMEQAKEQQAHIGSLLFPLVNSGGLWYPVLILGLTAILTGLGVWRTGAWWTGLLLPLPLSELIKHGTDFIALHLIRPRPVFRLALKDGVPAEGKTLCVISALLTDEKAVKALCQRLEDCYLTNRSAGEEVHYGLLSDLPDSSTAPGEEQRQLIAMAAAEVEALNRRWGTHFFLFTREPSYAAADDLYRGWERKRGALLELLSLLRGAPCGLKTTVGNQEALKGTAFLLTLDSDTRLAPDSIRVMVGTLLHPLNRPVVDPKRRIVVRGHGLLQPRMLTQLESSQQSLYASLFCGPAGSDPYTAAAGELYHDLFDRCSYCGKGLLDVEAAWTCLRWRFPENRILSHDLLEGAVLRAGFCPEAEAADRFPTAPQGDFRRLHRWVRGDWQAGRWCLPRVPNAAGQTEQNTLCPLDRWKVFDNLRRSLLSVGTLICLLAALIRPCPATLAAAALALLAMAAPALFSGAELSLRRFRGVLQRTFVPRWDGLRGSLLRLTAQLLLLPVKAWTEVSALCTALRRLHSRRGLLDWTVSGQEGKQNWFYAPNVAVGALLLLLTPVSPLGAPIGLLWLLSPLMLEHLTRQVTPRQALTRREQNYLLRQAALIWRYYDTWLRPEDHFLPPDNVQERPALGPARRTSPTNIGFALLACLAAGDLELAAREHLTALLSAQLDTLEQLEKWQGHLYNWYDTASAQPLYPRYVSTVDSGNLCAALLTLEAGLRDWGESDLAHRAGVLAAGMGFRPLYDPERDLFYIGWDEEAKSFTDSRYDLLASEARLTSYVAVARGEVPQKHWQRLSRTLCSQNHRFGLASWSGTLFEYFMPHLLLDAPHGSLLGESLSLCVWVQRRWGSMLGLPWGVSESGYSMLDQNRCYQYKAHGVPTLGLCRGLERERVIAPYASFLALGEAPHAAVENLRRLEQLGALGRFGFFEAIDFTPRRTGGRSIVVRSWMVHHLGMSLLAVDNLLQNKPMHRRFFAQSELRAHRCLLEERMPLGLCPEQRLPLSMERRNPKMSEYTRTGTGFDPKTPTCHLFSAGALWFPGWDSGEALLRQEDWLLCTAGHLTLTVNGRRRVLLPRSGGAELRSQIRGNHFSLHLSEKELDLTLERRLDEAGLVQSLHLTARQGGTLSLELVPILDREADYTAHQAFSRLGLEVHELPDGIRFTRRHREGRPDAPALTLLWEGPVKSCLREDAVLTLELALNPGTIDLRWVLCPGSAAEAYRAAQGLLMGLITSSEDGFSALGHRFSLSLREQRSLDRLTAQLLRPTPQGGAPKSALWPYGVSGDLPLWVVAEANLSTAERCLRQWAALRFGGLAFDLVLLLQNADRMALEQRCETLSLSTYLGSKGGIHLVEASSETSELFWGRAATIGLPQPPAEHCVGPMPPSAAAPKVLQDPEWHWNGTDFMIDTNGSLPPRRWSHVLTNGSFGWTADECGTGPLWQGNAHENPLTPWYNNPYALNGPEGLFVEEETRVSLFAARDGIPTRVTWGAGTARWEKAWNNRTIRLTAFVPPDREERIFLVEAEGFSPNAQLVWTLELQMAYQRSESMFVKISGQNGQVFAQNPANEAWTGETLTLLGSEVLSLAPGNTPNLCTLHCPLSQTLVLSAGTTTTPTAAVSAARDLLDETISHWKRQAGALHVETPDPALNRFLSFWGRYQVLACRIQARAGLYQCGGAYGFRDQLQDTAGLLPERSALAREQILRSCARQYEEGDVMHWWHPLPTGDRGVRTRISDDLLWLPWAVCRYAAVTGDRTLLTETVPFLHSPPLRKDERDRYEAAVPGRETGTVLEHCIRAVERVLGRGCGVHGLLKMGTGDWNDGMDRLGDKGRGESVWLTWFTIKVLRDLAPFCPNTVRERYERLANRLAEQAENAWDGSWYRRAYADDGSAVGSSQSPWCQVDSIAQSFAVFAPGPNPERSRQAVHAAIDRLWDPKTGTISLLAPPFPPDAGAGYVCAYPEGVRENGAQYTHAAMWLALAAFRLGEADRGWELLRCLLPEHHDPEVYQGEPYVLAGDVCTAPGKEGQAGWTWYTGAAAWYCRTATEELLGIQVRDGCLHLRPKLPKGWPGYSAIWQLDGAALHITVRTGEQKGLTLNGAPTEQGIPLSGLQGRVDLVLTL